MSNITDIIAAVQRGDAIPADDARTFERVVRLEERERCLQIVYRMSQMRSAMRAEKDVELLKEVAQAIEALSSPSDPA